MRSVIVAAVLLAVVTASSQVGAQKTDRADEKSALRMDLLRARMLLANSAGDAADRDVLDVQVCLKAVEWLLKHDEFFKPAWFEQARRVLTIGEQRSTALTGGTADWLVAGRTVVLGYRSRIDRSVQPYALTLPVDFDPKAARRYPLHLKLHGRANQMNEVNFFHRYHGKEAPTEQTWIQLDVYGRGNNAFRWAGETDVFEALADVKRRVSIDDRRITLHGFSMGGAGAWHLGMHYPHMWSSVGPGAGFVDFYRYQNQKEQRPPHEHASLGVYDSIDYALNAFNVPVCTYGGELDKQLLAGQSMTEAAAKLGVEIKLLIGPGMGHKFHPDSLREFMAFHARHTETGRPFFSNRRHIRFVTRTLKYNQCDWLAVEEMERVYEPAVVDARIDDNGTLQITAENVRVLRLARGLAGDVVINDTQLPLESAADGLLPDVYYRQRDDRWDVINYTDSKAFPNNAHQHKRHGLQGPIDDAFTEAFLCVRGSGEPWSAPLHQWAGWTLTRFSGEWDKWMRGVAPVVTDTELTDEQIAANNLVLFGDPGSNAVIKRIADRLPVKWERDSITIDGKTYSTATHGLALIYPNPLNPRRYVVINSGHTFHDRDFRASNSWLFPRLGDIAVVKFSRDGENWTEETVQAHHFDSDWKLP